jgi:hypothetical protein
VTAEISALCGLTRALFIVRVYFDFTGIDIPVNFDVDSWSLYVEHSFLAFASGKCHAAERGGCRKDAGC